MTLFSNMKREALFLAKQRYILTLLSTVFLLSVFAVWSGISETRFQLSTIESLLEKDAIDRNSVLAKQKDYGSAAYYSFHLTYSAPSAIAFSAIGQRDIYPWKHRIRMLAIEGQIYETDADNPELSFLGRFDFAFLVSVLLPLFVILLLHDLHSTEREAGRYDLLITTASSKQRLWLSRAIVLCSALGIALLVPFIIGSLVMQAPLMSVGLITLVVIAHLLFWMVLALIFSASKIAAKQSSAQIASVLLSVWLVVTVLIPVGSDLVIDAIEKSPNGSEIVLTQREAVNDAWDLPFNTTWDDFLTTHPQWEDKTQMSESFEWKWYYAFQQVGDQKTEKLSKAYRKSTLAKNTLAERFSLISPPMLTQRLMSSIAETDTNAAIKYEQAIREYHKALRHFYYPLMFNEAEFTLETLSGLPKFSHTKSN